jgi:hypothetical protein
MNQRWPKRLKIRIGRLEEAEAEAVNMSDFWSLLEVERK